MKSTAPDLLVVKEWEGMGEVGQYLAGRHMGFTKYEIMKKRGWTLEQADKYELEASLWIVKNRKGGK